MGSSGKIIPNPDLASTDHNPDAKRCEVKPFKLLCRALIFKRKNFGGKKKLEP